MSGEVLNFGVADEVLRAIIISGGAMGALFFFFSVAKNRVNDDAVRGQVISTLREELKSALDRVKEVEARADRFASERNDALQKVGSLETAVKHMEVKVAEMTRLARKQAKENSVLRNYIHDVVAEVHEFSKRNPKAALDLSLPDFPDENVEVDNNE